MSDPRWQISDLGGHFGFRMSDTKEGFKQKM
jgi:hypothetical protein